MICLFQGLVEMLQGGGYAVGPALGSALQQVKYPTGKILISCEQFNGLFCKICGIFF